MAPGVPLLTIDLLESLAQRWRAHRAPLLDFLRPSASSEEMDGATAPLGLRVPAEARVWWGWHDGVRRERRPFERQMAGTGWKFFSVRDAVAEAVVQRDRATRIAGAKADPLLWRWEWLPLADNFHGGVIAVDGSVPIDQPETPIFYTEPEVGAADAQPQTRTFGEMVQWWIEAFDEGAFGFDTKLGRWRYDPDRLDVARERTHVV